MTASDFISIAAVAASIGAVISTLLTMFRAKKKLERRKDAIIRYYRTILDAPVDIEGFKEAKKTISSALNSFITALDLSHEEYDLAASVRLLSYPDNDSESVTPSLSAVTFTRDDINSGSRERLRDYYPVESNTLLAKALNDKLPIFISDIESARDAMYYNTRNDSWKPLYRSAFVWPIIDEGKVLGFLCLDSKKKISEDSDLSKNIQELALPTVQLLSKVFHQAAKASNKRMESNG